ncbi:hypothetical protein [Dankookia sp. P2]|uniref:hypothetical protein n=1 Tax=Dankookia sp. P2 TaxID=3423955 RepID=UPI003D66604B
MRGPLLGMKVLQPVVAKTAVVAPSCRMPRRERGRVMKEADIRYPYGGNARRPSPTLPATGRLAVLREPARHWREAADAASGAAAGPREGKA